MKPALLLAASILAAAADPNAAFKSGDFNGAKQGFAAALAANPRDAASLAGLAAIELYENRIADASRDAQSALTIDPANVRAGRVLHTAQLRAGKQGEFVVMQTADSVLPFVVSRPLPIVNMQIDGIAARVLIDTGAPTFVVGEAFARAHGIKTAAAGQGTFAGGKTAAVYGATVNRIDLPNLTVRNVSASVLPLPPIGPGVEADAIVGTSFFTHFLTTIDYPQSRLVLRPANAESDTKNAAANVPMWLVGDHFIFAQGRVNGGPAQLFNIDTGGGGMGVQLTKESLAQARITPDIAHAQTFTGGAGPTRAAPFTADVTMGNASVRGVPGLYFLDGDQYGIFPFTPAGTISHEFFKRYALTFDFTNMRLILQ